MQVFRYAVGHYRGPENPRWGPEVGVIVAKDKEQAMKMARRRCRSDDAVWWLERIPISKRMLFANIDREKVQRTTYMEP